MRRLGRNVVRLEEQVHQHGLAAADGAENIEPLGRRLGAREQAAKPFAAAPVPQRARRVVEPRGDRGLRRVGLDHAGREQGAILSRRVIARLG